MKTTAISSGLKRARTKFKKSFFNFAETWQTLIVDTKKHNHKKKHSRRQGGGEVDLLSNNDEDNDEETVVVLVPSSTSSSLGMDDRCDWFPK